MPTRGIGENEFYVPFPRIVSTVNTQLRTQNQTLGAILGLFLEFFPADLESVQVERLVRRLYFIGSGLK